VPPAGNDFDLSFNRNETISRILKIIKYCIADILLLSRCEDKDFGEPFLLDEAVVCLDNGTVSVFLLSLAQVENFLRLFSLDIAISLKLSRPMIHTHAWFNCLRDYFRTIGTYSVALTSRHWNSFPKWAYGGHQTKDSLFLSSSIGKALQVNTDLPSGFPSAVKDFLYLEPFAS